MVILLSIFNNLYSIILNLFFPVGCDFDEYAAIFTTQYDTSAQAGQSKLTTINPKQITTISLNITWTSISQKRMC